MNPHQLLRLLTAGLIALGICSVSSGDEIAEAKQAFISGMKHFDLGEYDDALNDFKNGYRAKEDPVFLYNIAQCYRLKNEHRDAIRYYRLYLSRAPDAPNRAEIEERIAKLQAIVDNERPAAPAPAPSASQRATSVPTTTPSAEVSTVAASRQRTPVYKKWWLWTVVGVVAVGAGVGLGVGLTRSATPSGTTFPSAGF